MTLPALKEERSYNREGAAFDKGETFSGVPYELGLTAAQMQAVRRVYDQYLRDIIHPQW